MAGTLWLAARTKTVAGHIANPAKRALNTASKKRRLATARAELEQLENELDLYCYSYEELDEMDDDERDAIISDNTWWPFHNRLMELCRANHLRSPRLDEEWEPAIW